MIKYFYFEITDEMVKSEEWMRKSKMAFANEPKVGKYKVGIKDNSFYFSKNDDIKQGYSHKTNICKTEEENDRRYSAIMKKIFNVVLPFVDGFKIGECEVDKLGLKKFYDEFEFIYYNMELGGKKLYEIGNIVREEFIVPFKDYVEKGCE